MKISEMTDTLFDREMAALLGQVQFWCMRLSGIDPKYKLEPTPVSNLDGTGKQPFPLALELKRAWDYARGVKPRPDELREIIQDLCELLWAPVGAGTYEIPSSWWETPLGTMVKICQARDALEGGHDLDTYQLALLSDLTDKRIRQLCQSGEIKAEKVPREASSQEQWAIPAEEARRFLESRDML